MAVDLAVYRARIGRFCGGSASRLCKARARGSVYSHFTKWTDVHFRSVCLFMVLVPLFLAGGLAAKASAVYQATCLSDQGCGLTVSGFDVAKFRLILSGDVETNPGPADIETVLLAVKSSEQNILSQIQALESDMREIKGELSSLRRDQDRMKSELGSLKDTQDDFRVSQRMTDDLLEQARGVTENMQLDVDHLIHSVEANEERIEGVKKEVERLNRLSISNNMRVFGLQMENGQTNSQRIRCVIDKVLSVACPDIRWVPDDVKKVHVVQGDSGATPLVVVTFRHDDDRSRMYAGREALRAQSIRVGDDLTYAQRDDLKRLKSKGQTGYFFRGELRVRPERRDGAEAPTRTRNIKQAVRQLPRPGVAPVQHAPSGAETMQTL